MKIFLTEEKCVINLILFLRALRGAAGNALGNQKSPGAAPYELFLAVTDVPAAALGQAEAKGSSWVTWGLRSSKVCVKPTISPLLHAERGADQRCQVGFCSVSIWSASELLLSQTPQIYCFSTPTWQHIWGNFAAPFQRWRKPGGGCSNLKTAHGCAAGRRGGAKVWKRKKKKLKNDESKHEPRHKVSFCSHVLVLEQTIVLDSEIGS